MTIEIHGYIHSLEAIGGGGQIAVTIHAESSRIDNPHALTIAATPEEVEHYKVGMPITIVVRPDMRIPKEKP